MRIYFLFTYWTRDNRNCGWNSKFSSENYELPFKVRFCYVNSTENEQQSTHC